MTPDHPLPSLDDDEVDAVLLGLHLASGFYAGEDDEGDDGAPERALRKIEASLPPPRPARSTAIAPPKTPKEIAAFASRAIEAEQKLRISYTDAKGRATERVVWPIEAAAFIASGGIAAWCETRRSFRHFRFDRIRTIALTGERLPTRRRVLLAAWRAEAEPGDR